MNKLDNILDIEVTKGTEIVFSDEFSIHVPLDGIEEDVDYNFVRASHYKLASQADEAMSIAMRVARESENPKAIDSLSNLLKTSSEVSRQLLNLSKDKAEVKNIKNVKQSPAAQIGTQNNIVFTGSSSELNKILKTNNIEENKC